MVGGAEEWRPVQGERPALGGHGQAQGLSRLRFHSWGAVADARILLCREAHSLKDLRNDPDGDRGFAVVRDIQDELLMGCRGSRSASRRTDQQYKEAPHWAKGTGPWWSRAAVA